MEFLEKNLEDIICETPGNILRKRGFVEVPQKRYRQVNFGGYGIADIITIVKRYDNDEDGFISPYYSITVYELKQNGINTGAFLQAIRYCKAIYHFIGNREIPVRFNIVLCGKTFDKKSDFCYLTDLISSYNEGVINSFRCYTYDYRFDGIHFKRERGYSLIDPCFCNKIKANIVVVENDKEQEAEERERFLSLVNLDNPF